MQNCCYDVIKLKASRSQKKGVNQEIYTQISFFADFLLHIYKSDKNESTLMKFCTNYLVVVCQVFISSDLNILNLIASWRSFCVFLIRHSHGRIFAPISFKFSGKVQNCLWTLSFENRQIRLITSAVMADCVFKINPLIQTC